MNGNRREGTLLYIYNLAILHFVFIWTHFRLYNIKIGFSSSFGWQIDNRFSFIGILIFHHNSLLVALNLTITGSGLSLLNGSQININPTSTHIKYKRISFVVNTLFHIGGSANGPIIAGMFIQANQQFYALLILM